MPLAKYQRIGHHKTVESFKAHVNSLGIDLPCDEEILKAPAIVKIFALVIASASTPWRDGMAKVMAIPRNIPSEDGTTLA